ncbi:MAG TPA: 2-oxoacid:acceptor oxidoreductase subunit alpha, partial [Synergistaceae bacterium]|nr:2-oxoacid:acceptor oxidoreductase subunit alpha [Synergistaceae bacterium]
TKIKRLVRKVNRFRKDIVRYEVFYGEDAKMLIVSYGSVARSSLRAVREARQKGLKVGHFRPITLWPFPDEELQGLASQVDVVIVPELNCGQMLLEVERAVNGKAPVMGKSLVNGELFQPSDILSAIEEVA